MTQRKRVPRKLVAKNVTITAKDLKNYPRPLCPWPLDKARKMWEESQVDGHRQVWIKCRECTLEYSVLTWRAIVKNGYVDLDENMAPWHFRYCPECGSKDAGIVLRVDHELGRISERPRQ